MDSPNEIRLVKESDRKITIIFCLCVDFACINTLFWQNFKLQGTTWACQKTPVIWDPII